MPNVMIKELDEEDSWLENPLNIMLDDFKKHVLIMDKEQQDRGEVNCALSLLSTFTATVISNILFFSVEKEKHNFILTEFVDSLAYGAKMRVGSLIKDKESKVEH